MELTDEQARIMLGWAYSSIRDRTEDWGKDEEALLRSLIEVAGLGYEHGLDSPVANVIRRQATAR